MAAGNCKIVHDAQLNHQNQMILDRAEAVNFVQEEIIGIGDDGKVDINPWNNSKSEQERVRLLKEIYKMM